MLKLAPDLKYGGSSKEFFAPSDWLHLDDVDLDLGTAGCPGPSPIPLPCSLKPLLPSCCPVASHPRFYPSVLQPHTLGVRTCEYMSTCMCVCISSVSAHRTVCP